MAETGTRDTRSRVWPFVTAGTVSGLAVWGLVGWAAASPHNWFLAGFIALNVVFLHTVFCVGWDELDAKRERDRLREAIQQHRDECLSDDLGEPTMHHGVAVYTHTVKLWDVLNEIPDTPMT